jgi:hypothetical protein
VSATADYEVVAKYNSTRNPANVYEVQRRRDGSLWCTCPGCRFSKETPKTCRHIRRVREGLDDDAVVAERVERATLFLETFRLHPVAIYAHQYQDVVRALPAAAMGERRRDQYWLQAEAVLKLVDALDASGIFGPRPERRPAVAPSRGMRIITLDD